MMDNILTLLKEQQMNQPAPQPVPTEKAQIAIHYIQPHPSLVFRFNTVKKGQQEYDRLLKVWQKFNSWEGDGKRPNRLHYVNADMFSGMVDLGCIAACMFIDHVKRDKFVPIP